ncbi:MAG: lipoprotein-releasing ABC transporter permease subunit [Candidatus Omnitrophica bacterium]|nr:lipoprotein-releasing ABC transporter permease subunit [Candidatus Omnitrophota bacterium]
MGFESFIASKHLTHRRKTGFISLISVISMGGVAVGVMALIVVLAVMSGFDRELKQKIVNVQPHIRIEKMGGLDDYWQVAERIESLRLPGLESLSPFIEGQAIVRSAKNATGVLLKGVDDTSENLTIFENHMVYGNADMSDEVTIKVKRSFLFRKKEIEERQGGILIGEVLAARLGVRVGDDVMLISPFQKKTGSFTFSEAESRPFRVKGIFRVGMSDFDSTLALISLEQAQNMYHLEGRVTGLSLRFFDVDDAEKWKWVLRGEFPGNYVVRSWYDMNHNFFQALKVEKSVMTILLALIILVAVFNIVSTLTMTVMEKTKDIGILRAIGATKASIRKIFVMEGFGIGFVGIAAGAILGLALAFNLNEVSEFLKRTTGLEVFPSDIYYFDKIPVEIHSQDVLWTVTLGLIASVLAGLYPAHRAANLKPVEALRYE